ncbi:MAG: cystathionine beta-lyase, partial [Aeromicrobium sp.]|nr:cystathionine beta-lyase [Aeromicrobium sp.]
MHPLRELSLDDLRQRTSIKWREFDPDVLPLWVAEMDVRLARPVIEAMTTAITDGDTGYPCGSGYAEAYAEFAAGRWGWEGVDSTRTALVADVMTGIVEVFALVSEPGDPVVVNPPVYPPFFGFIDHSHRAVVEAPLGEDGRLDLDALEAAFIHAGAEGRPVTYLLCNPQNPTAVFHTADELAGVSALAATYGVRVVVDEIHGPLVPEGFVPYLSVEGTGNAFAIAS